MPDTVHPVPRMGPTSPCINFCALDAEGFCGGCLRTREEIAAWISLSADEQWALLQRLEARRAERVTRRGAPRGSAP
jgi:hypothetical protein